MSEGSKKCYKEFRNFMKSKGDHKTFEKIEAMCKEHGVDKTFEWIKVKTNLNPSAEKIIYNALLFIKDLTPPSQIQKV